MKINVYMDDRRTPFLEDVAGIPQTDHPDTYWVIARTIEDTKVLLLTGIVENISIDHDMGDGDTGYDLVKWMEETNTWPSGNIAVHSANPVGRDNMLAVLKKHYESQTRE